MTNQETLSAVQTKLNDLTERLERHQKVVQSIQDKPEGHDTDAVKSYLTTLDESLTDADFLDKADASLEPLEEAAEAAEEAALEGARVFIDDYEIEGVTLQYLHDDPQKMEASLLVESPKVNQLRGGRPKLALPDGREYYFTIRQTIIAEVRDDKSGYLKLELGLEEI
jgi:hypothetical protein